MQVREERSGLLVVSLERGESVRESVETLCAEHTRLGAPHPILGARISAIGAIKDPEFGFYRLDRKEYDRRTFTGIWELVSFEGSISTVDGETPFMHAHVAIGGPDFGLKGGHLFDARVGVVVELFIRPLEEPLGRIMCEDIGLPRWEPAGNTTEVL